MTRFTLPTVARIFSHSARVCSLPIPQSTIVVPSASSSSHRLIWSSWNGSGIESQRTPGATSSAVPGALSNPALNGSGGDAGEAKLVPSFFFAMDLGPKWNIGLGVSVPFGLATKYDSNWIGRFQGVQSEVETVNINPAVSFKVSGAVSIGGGISYQHGKVDLTTAVNYSAAAFAVGGAPALGAVGGPGGWGPNTTRAAGEAGGFNSRAPFKILPPNRPVVRHILSA